MTQRRDANDESDEATDETGDAVEAAGETTASALIGGDDPTRPVGADTQVRVEGDTHPADD